MSDAAELIWVTFGGKTFKCSRRTAAHLAFTDYRLQKRQPGAYIHVIQGCFNTTIEASEGTHDGDRVLDVQIVGMDWNETQRFLRSCGWAAWLRTPAQGFDYHVHMISIGGAPTPVGVYIPAQIDDYYNHTYGLANQHNVDLDKSWFPGDEGPPPWPIGTPEQWRADIDKTIFDYPAWVASAEERAVADAVDRIIGEIRQNRTRMNTAFAAERERDKRRFDALMAAVSALADDAEADADKIRARLRALKAELAELGTEDEPVEP